MTTPPVHFNTTHGEAGKNHTRLYSKWTGMVSRCTNPKDPRYKYYGARGIEVCPEWRIFTNFRDWAITHGYREDLTIERVDVDGNYTAGNCTWIPLAAQQRNTTNTHWIEAWGEKKSLVAWIEDPRCSVTRSCVKDRLKLHSDWTPEEIIGNPPVRTGRPRKTLISG